VVLEAAYFLHTHSLAFFLATQVASGGVYAPATEPPPACVPATGPRATSRLCAPATELNHFAK
jgi:hypothetical protein